VLFSVWVVRALKQNDPAVVYGVKLRDNVCGNRVCFSYTFFYALCKANV
jgi:hypothetical protein